MAGPRVSKGRIAFYVVLAVGMLLGILFVPAGRLDWWPGWAYFGLIALTTSVSTALVTRRNPELAHRRLTIGEGTKPWDRVMLGLVKATFLGAIVLGAYDAGRHGADLPAWLWPIGAAFFFAGNWILTASMLENTHFESTVRIQTDRDHRVIDTGPYSVPRCSSSRSGSSWRRGCSAANSRATRSTVSGSDTGSCRESGDSPRPPADSRDLDREWTTGHGRIKWLWI
jgi:hypothetical protein